MLLNQTGLTDIEDLKRRGARVSYSQFGEDMVVLHHLRHEGGFYVDVGCHDPHRFSNTAIFYLYRKWRGINIDADPWSIERFGRARPRDININCGVSDEVGKMDFTIFKDHAQNSFDQAMTARAASSLDIERVESILVRPLRDILADNMPEEQQIDYMNIDCEGLDDKVIAGNDWKRFSPRVLTVEVHGLNLTNAADHPTVRALREVGYRLHSHCVVTSVFLRIS